MSELPKSWPLDGAKEAATNWIFGSCNRPVKRLLLFFPFSNGRNWELLGSPEAGAFTAEALASVSGWGTKIPCAMWHGQKKATGKNAKQQRAFID